MLVYEKYIGYIKTQDQNRCAVYGTCFFISANKAVAAAHTFDNTCEPYTIHISGCDYSFTKDDIETPENTQCAILTLEQSVFPDYDISLFSYNLNFNISRVEDYIWNTSGYFMESSDLMKMYRLSGTQCSVSSDDYLCCLIDPRPKSLSYHGMSGSPVFINDLLVGILQVEEYGYDTVENLYLSSATEFKEHLPESAITKDVYHNQQIPRIDYSEQFSINELIKRKYSKKSDNSVCSFDELLRENSESHTYVLLGEAGLGKTEELKRLAVECPDDLHPLHCSLRDLTSGISLSDYVPELKKYIEYKVPFCLILDGYDEIKSYPLREDVFPGLMGQLISEINAAAIKRYFIIIGSRTAFYYDNKFEGFTQLTLRKLTKEDIDNVLDKNTVDHDSFYSEVDKKSLNTFIENPFYLFHIVDLYKSNRGQLSESNKLMDSIISMLMKKQNEGVFSPEKIREAKAFLRKVSACFMLRAFKSGDNTDNDLLELIESYVNPDQRDLIRKTGIVDADESGNMTFIHNNYFEYLAAEFFNKKYKNNLDGLLSLIAYENQKGIFNNFKNMVTYLLLIRETPDLKEWIVKNCPDAIESIESKDLTEEMSLSRLELIFKEARKKGYFIGRDFERDISSVIHNRSSISYLVGLLNTSDDSLELYNAIQLIDNLHNLYGMERELRAVLLEFIISDRADSNLKCDAFNAICDLNLSDSKTEKYIFEHFSKCSEGEILLGLDRYIYKNDLADLFAENLINQYSDKRLLNQVGMRVYDCLGCFHSADSMIKLYEAILNKGAKGLRNNMLNTLEKVLEKNNQSLIEQYEGKKAPDRLVNIVIKLSLFLLGECYLRNNAFSGFLNATKNDSLAIRCYFSNTEGKAVVFRLLSKDLNCFTEFLIKGYQNQLFVGQNLIHFRYCVRELGKDNPDRERCLEAIRSGNDNDKEDDISYITYHDDYLEKEETRKAYHKQIIFDYPLFKQKIHEIIKLCGAEDPEFTDLFMSVSGKYPYNSIECDTIEYFRSIHFIEKPVSVTLNHYDTHEEEWMVIIASEFVKKNKDYLTYLGQIDVLSEAVLKVLSDARKITDRVLLESVLHLTLELRPSVPKNTLLQLLYINPYYYPDHPDMRYPEFIIERLSPKEIIQEIERSIDAGMPQHCPDLANAFLCYCSERGYTSDRTVSLAESTLSCKSDNAFFQATVYLLTYFNEDILIKKILDGTITKRRFINYSFYLTSINAEKLSGYVRSLWCDLESLQNAEITEENLDRYIKKYDYVDLRGERHSVDLFKKGVHECMRNLYYYMFKNNIDNCINNYLDEMIANKTASKYEPGNFEFLVSEITSTEYLKKMITVLQIIYDGDFAHSREMYSFSTEIERAMTVMSQNSPQEVISMLFPYLNETNTGFRRAVNLIYDNSYMLLYQSEDKEYKISKIKEIVFS